MRLLICAGGTGGGVYPAITITEILKTETNQILWVGSEGGMEKELVNRANLSYLDIPAAGVHGVSMAKLPGNLKKLLDGYRKSRRIVKDFDPDALLFTGGYVAIPMAIAGIKKKSLLFVPDIEPGLALKVLSWFSDRIAVNVEESRRFMKHKENVFVTGYPIRSDLKKWGKTQALEYFQFEPNVPTLLFQGGSSGARSINNAVISIIDSLVKKYQVIHLTGLNDWESVQDNTKNINKRYQVFPYLHEIGAALAAADLVISRAGASVLGEYPFFGLPAILVPYPYAWRYQKMNADYLVNRHAAIEVEDSRLITDLFPTINMLFDDPTKLSRMKKAMISLMKPDAAEQISSLLVEMAQG